MINSKLAGLLLAAGLSLGANATSQPTAQSADDNQSTHVCETLTPDTLANDFLSNGACSQSGNNGCARQTRPPE